MNSTTPPQNEPLWLEIDGRLGGGQLLRTSLTLSTLCRRPFRISDIRQTRPQPGLRAQHSTAAKAMTELCGATSTGIEVGSRNLTYAPSRLPSGEHALSIGTAGATSLLLHTLFYPMALGKEGGELQLFGGTHGSMAPTFDYLQEVWAPLIRACGWDITLEIPFYGLYPKGRGQLTASIPGQQRPQPVRWLERPFLKRVWIRTLIADTTDPSEREEEDKALEEIIGGVAAETLGRIGITAKRELHSRKAASPGVLCYIFCEYGELRAGFSVWGRKNGDPEVLGAEVASLAFRFLTSSAVLDEHAADQLLLPLCLATGDSCFTTTELTAHLKSNASLIEQFLPWRRIHLEEQPDGAVLVSIEQKGPRPESGLDADEWEEDTWIEYSPAVHPDVGKF